LNFQINQLPEMRIIGKVVYPNMNMKENLIPEFWDKCFEDDTFTKLEGLKDLLLPSKEVRIVYDKNYIFANIGIIGKYYKDISLTLLKNNVEFI